MTIDVLGDGDDEAVIGHVVRAQLDPTRHVTFVGDTPVSVRGDLERADAWTDHTLVARDGDDVTGVVTLDVDHDRGRMWWLGPWGDAATADALLEAAEDRFDLPRQREFAPDSRNDLVARLALARGYVAEEASAVLACDLTAWPTVPLPLADGVRPLEDDDRAHVGRVHDQVFPGTHTIGADLVRDQDTRVFVLDDDDPAGYCAVQVQADGTGYIDFLGVEPGHRGRGHGRALIAAAMTALAEEGVPAAFLTVRVGNAAARALYASLGFEEERIAVPYRLGFRVDRPR